MISITKTDIKNSTTFIGEYRGLSTDTKPTEDVGNGSVFIEIDTGNIYMYDEENEQWKEI